MAGEVVRWFASGSVDRQRNRELDAVDHAGDIAETQVANIGRVTKRAVYESMLTNMLRQKAEQIASDGAELYAMLTIAGAVASAEVIESMNVRSRRCTR